MTQEEKDLLLKDLCCRLLYGGMMYNTNTKQDIPIQYFACMTDCKPYLRPMSSMTGEEFEEFTSLVGHIFIGEIDFNKLDFNAFDWLNAHHFDYRGLIEKGLALEAPDGMYNIK